MKLIRKIFVWLYITTYFRHIYVISKMNATDVNMFVLSHKNGAIDGFVYYYALKRGVFLLSKQLHRNPFLKFIFPGISIYRPKDKQNAVMANESAVKECFGVLKDRKEPLCIFPEGTSSLGPKSLPFHNGYAKMALINAKTGSQTILMPVGIIYDDPTCMGGSVWIVFGEKIFISSHMSQEQIQEKTLASFQKVTLDYPSVEVQSLSHQGAIIASLSKKYSYFFIAKNIAKNEGVLNLIKTYTKRVDKGVKYKNTIVYPQNVFLSLWVLLITFPIVVATLLIYFVPIIVGYLFGRTRKDDQNTISLWRTLTGYPIALLFLCGFFLISPIGALCSLPFCVWGFHLYGAFKKHLIMLVNFVFYHTGYAYFKEVQNAILSKIEK